MTRSRGASLHRFFEPVVLTLFLGEQVHNY